MISEQTVSHASSVKSRHSEGFSGSTQIGPSFRDQNNRQKLPASTDRNGLSDARAAVLDCDLCRIFTDWTTHAKPGSSMTGRITGRVSAGRCCCAASDRTGCFVACRSADAPHCPTQTARRLWSGSDGFRAGSCAAQSETVPVEATHRWTGSNFERFRRGSVCSTDFVEKSRERCRGWSFFPDLSPSGMHFNRATNPFFYRVDFPVCALVVQPQDLTGSTLWRNTFRKNEACLRQTVNRGHSARSLIRRHRPKLTDWMRRWCRMKAGVLSDTASVRTVFNRRAPPRQQFPWKRP